MKGEDAIKSWRELVEEVRREHNGVMGVRLFFGHDGHNVCKFEDYDRTIAEGESGRTMDEAVSRCIQSWELERKASWFARNPESEFCAHESRNECGYCVVCGHQDTR